MKTLRALPNRRGVAAVLALTVGATLIVGAVQARAWDGAVMMYATSQDGLVYGRYCGNTTFTPGVRGEIKIHLMMELHGATAGGISGVEGFIEGVEDLQGGWTSRLAPTSGAMVVGDFFTLTDPNEDGIFETRRGNLVFAVDGTQPELGCRTGDVYDLPVVSLGVLEITNNGEVDIPAGYHLSFVGASPGTLPQFGCPIVTLCDAPVYTAVCVQGGDFWVNSSVSCATAVGPSTWSTIKSFYR